jgi:succinate dehydrogenase / fumarate reductase cytochrome b subunit
MEKETGYGTGMWAWLLQRITGVLLVFYLFIHIVWAHGIKTPLDFMFVEFKTSSVLILLILVLPHALNGFRVFAIDFGVGERTQKILFWTLVLIGILVLIWGIP